MARYYIEAYGHDHEQILGNLDGQDTVACTFWKRSASRKLLLSDNRPKWERVKYWLIVTEQRNIVEQIDNPRGSEL